MLKGCQKLQKHLMKILLFLIFLPIANASSFIGSFNDYGNDIDSDGLFNYLTIEAGAYITQANSYIIFGRLEDSEGNFIEYEDCRSLTTGNYNFILDFDGRQIYRNQVNGPYTLTYIELSLVNDCDELGFPTLEDSLENAYTTSFYEYKKFQKGEAAIYCNSSPCTASSNLIKSRDDINIKEPNAPNTIDGCEDGLYGTYLDTESIESITVTSLKNSFFQVGDIIKVDITVYCDEGSDDRLNFVYSNDIDNIQWEVKDNQQCSSNGIQTFSTTFALDNNVGKHAIRGVFSFTLEPNTVCGQDETDDTSYWADNDDVVIYVRDSEDQGKHKIDLVEGWNLISLPKIEDNDINAIANIFNNFEKIITLKNGNWYIYDKLNLANSNLNELSESNGFWIRVNDNLTILIENESAAYTLFQLTKGWNLIGYPSLEEKDVNELFQNVMDDIELIYVYNDEFESFNPKNPSNFLIKPGMGIFVKIKDDALWYFNGTYNKNEDQESFNLNLTEGWNLISIPLTSDKTTSQMFGTKLYYLENQKWKQLEGNDEIDYSYSYWVKADESSLLIEGDRINNLLFDINPGWNLVNYPLTTETNTDVFFQNVIGNIESITSFENGEWKSFNPLRSNGLNSLNVLKPGKGIFVKAKDNAQWHFDGNELVAT